MSIKEQKQSNAKEFKLDNFEFEFLKSIATARNNSYNDFQATISAFLAYLAGKEWGLGSDEIVDFKLNEEERTVTVTPHVEK